MTKSGGSVLLAAGGTGGHLFPAFSLAEELQRRGHVVDLMTDMRGDRYGTGFPARHVLRVPSATLASRSPVAMARTAYLLSRGTLAAIRHMRKDRPAVVVGFGGYPTLPPLAAARLLGIPSIIHEQNAVLGRANRLLARRVDAIATSFDQTKLLDAVTSAKARLTGNPVRDAVIEAARTPYAAPEGSAPVHIVVFGGSQGARVFSETVPPAFAALDGQLKGRLAVTQQARDEDIDGVRRAYAAAGIAADVAAFFADLPGRMAASQLVIARAGASTVAELAVMGRPSILVPLPHALDSDQLENATRLAELGGCWCIEQRNLTPERLAREIARLVRDPSTLSFAARAAGSQGRPDAVKRLAALVEDLMRRDAPRQVT